MSPGRWEDKNGQVKSSLLNPMSDELPAVEAHWQMVVQVSAGDLSRCAELIPVPFAAGLGAPGHTSFLMPICSSTLVSPRESSVSRTCRRQ